MKRVERVCEDQSDLRERVRAFTNRYNPDYDAKRWTDEVFDAILTGTPPMALWRIADDEETLGHVLAQPLQTHGGTPFLFVHQAEHDGPHDPALWDRAETVVNEYARDYGAQWVELTTTTPHLFHRRSWRTRHVTCWREVAR